METREYVEYLLKNYNEILKDIEQLKFELKTFKDIESDEVIESLNFSSPNDEKISTSSISDKTCKIALIYNEVTNRMNKESREEIYRMMKATEFEITRLNYCIDRLEPQVKEVVKKIFIEKLSWSETCEKCDISQKTLNKYKKKGVSEIVEIFDLRRLVS
ncbi:sigma factor-like helix-turn-helix DNA-binding protein [Clostridium tyrobutyricum]|uniref:sigma factor-like helix-turn-helix DNA-binding protein n=1 Tax=Clostridium tyrobutyricum TaxID=1519 RepID=UPI0011C88B13|nr:sigma factor-like helix-turn-helix DNA-binding protein [Clostridium tyrobutyricum]